jgi:uncharacterized protein (TIGR04255 family)
MSYGPDIPTVDHEVFANPPLKAMLGQIRFPPVLRITDLSALAGYQDAIRHEFPTFAQEQQITLMVGPQGAQNSSANTAYRFSTTDRAWSVVLTPEAMTLEADVAIRYTSYGEFISRFRMAWEAVCEHFRPSQVLRQGLRYVDHLEGDWRPTEWARYINCALLGPLVGAFNTGIDQSVSELRFSREDGVLVFKHGILALGPEAQMGYLLDFDYFTEEADDDVSADTVVRRFDRYHELLYSFFRWCVTEEALAGFRDAR